MTERMAFSVEEVCAMLGVSHVTVYARIKDGSLRSAAFGRRRLILRKDVEAMLPKPEPEPLAPEEVMDGWVYFIDDGFFIKIGFSKDPRDRMIKLQTASPFKLNLLRSVVGNRRMEGDLHKKFSHLNSQGEWFRGERELREYIRELKA